MTLVNRWYQVIKLLVDHKGMSLQELQEKLAASPQTVRKNIDTSVSYTHLTLPTKA